MRHLHSYETQAVAGGELLKTPQVAYVVTLLVASTLQAKIENLIKNSEIDFTDSYIEPYIQPVLKAGSMAMGYMFSNKVVG